MTNKTDNNACDEKNMPIKIMMKYKEVDCLSNDDVNS